MLRAGLETKDITSDVEGINLSAPIAQEPASPHNAGCYIIIRPRLIALGVDLAAPPRSAGSVRPVRLRYRPGLRAMLASPKASGRRRLWLLKIHDPLEIAFCSVIEGSRC